MKRLVLLVLTLFLTLGLSKPAAADLMIEPYGSFGAGKFKGDGDADIMGGGFYGGRLALSMFGLLFIGGDYQTGRTKVKDSEGNLDPEDNLDDSTTWAGTVSDLGATAGIEFPILLRLYGSYFPGAHMRLKGAGKEYNFKGSGYKLGLSFTGLPFLCINFEYYHATYDDRSPATTKSGDHTANMVMVGLSLPIYL